VFVIRGEEIVPPKIQLFQISAGVQGVQINISLKIKIYRHQSEIKMSYLKNICNLGSTWAKLKYLLLHNKLWNWVVQRNKN
jgi:hypothetical protein